MNSLTRQITRVDPTIIDTDIKRALEEDIGAADVTAQLIPVEKKHAAVVVREAAVLCGTAWFEAVFLALDPGCQITWHKQDGERINQNDIVCDIDCQSRELLTAERSALNFLQTLSATATLTAQYVDAIKDTPCKVLDTRKTIPGLRMAQKFAVHCGGGINHRSGLHDMILIKENHITAAGSISDAVKKAIALQSDLPIEVEIETIEELTEALSAGVKRILLDNMPVKTLTEAVKLNNGQATLEASGNITLDNIVNIAQTGVDFISLGALTKNVRAIDFSLGIK